MTTPITREEALREWVEVLRSDRYQQGRGRLRTEDGKYCCLGVACDLMEKRGIGWWEKKSGSWFFCIDDAKSRHGLPFGICALLDLSPACGFDDDFGNSISLIGLNDFRKFTFSEIADVIESKFLKVTA